MFTVIKQLSQLFYTHLLSDASSPSLPSPICSLMFDAPEIRWHVLQDSEHNTVTSF